MPTLCLIEDDAIMGESLADRFQLEGFELDWFRTGGEASHALEQRAYDVVVSDIRLPDLSGEDLFTALAARGRRRPPFLFVTAHGSLDRAVALLKQGAADYVTKPFDIAELVAKVRQAAGEHDGSEDTGEPPGVLGRSRAIRALEQQAPRIAARARTVLVTGESGSGKEVLARHLHQLAFPQGQAPFVAVNCGAIPETLIEAELFGHERGAYTGADRARRGHFEKADGGTLVLDEIAELSPALQVKLLRVLQDRRIRRLGGDAEIAVDLRLLCATHRDLRALVEQGRFREDLYYRIHVVHLRVPPLRDRPEDVLWLAERFLEAHARQQVGRAARAGRQRARRAAGPCLARERARTPQPPGARLRAHAPRGADRGRPLRGRGGRAAAGGRAADAGRLRRRGRAQLPQGRARAPRRACRAGGGHAGHLAQDAVGEMPSARVAHAGMRRTVANTVPQTSRSNTRQEGLLRPVRVKQPLPDERGLRLRVPRAVEPILPGCSPRLRAGRHRRRPPDALKHQLAAPGREKGATLRIPSAVCIRCVRRLSAWRMRRASRASRPHSRMGCASRPERGV